MADDKYAIPLTSADWEGIFGYLREKPTALFHDDLIRKAIVRRRAEHFGLDQAYAGDRSAMIDIAVEYNRQHMHNALESHSQRLIWPLVMLDPFYTDRASMRVLSVGPRTEGELFKLMAAGFSPDKIDAIDIVSNSPLIEVGDMHDIKKPDNTYDAIIAGWLLPYSREPKRALAEMCRVLKSGGVIAIGLTREPEDSAEHQKLIAQGSATYLSINQIMADFPDSARLKLLFAAEPDDRSRKGAILMIARVLKV